MSWEGYVPSGQPVALGPADGSGLSDGIDSSSSTLPCMPQWPIGRTKKACRQLKSKLRLPRIRLCRQLRQPRIGHTATSWRPGQLRPGQQPSSALELQLPSSHSQFRWCRELSRKLHHHRSRQRPIVLQLESSTRAGAMVAEVARAAMQLMTPATLICQGSGPGSQMAMQAAARAF